MKWRSSHRARVWFVVVCCHLEYSMPTRALVRLHYTGVAVIVFHQRNVLVSRVIWALRLVRLIKPKTAPIAFASLAELPIANRKFVRHVVEVCVERVRTVARASVSNVQSIRSYAWRVVSALLKIHGVMEFKIVLMMSRIVRASSRKFMLIEPRPLVSEKKRDSL